MAKGKHSKNDVGWAGECRASDTSLKCDHTAGWDYPDKSTKCKGGSVNASSTRGETARSSSLGGREA
jgi:hypothetical protein